MPNDEVRRMNQVRRQRAQAALREQTWSLKQQGPGWSLTTPTGSYELRSDGVDSLSCNCQDYQRHQAQGVRCKHVHALALLQDQAAAPAGQSESPKPTQASEPAADALSHNTEPPEPSLLNPYAQIKAQLEEPFALSELQYKPQYLPKGSDGKSKAEGRCRVAVYADLRAYIARLDAAAKGSWQDQVQSVLTTENKLVVCVRLSILDISHSNLGEAPLSKENAATIAYAQAFKRACADHGLGSYLYRLPDLWVPYTLKGRGQVQLLEKPRLPRWAHPRFQGPATPEGRGAKPRLRMGLDQAQRTACPVQTADFPDIQGRLLGELQQSHPQGKRILGYLASEDFLRTATTPQRSQAHMAARVLLNQARSTRPAAQEISPNSHD